MASNKTIVLVTGANRGIGYEIVAALLRSPPAGSGSTSGAPYHAILCSRSSEKGEAALKSLSAEHGNTVSMLQLDVTSAESISAAVKKVEAEFGRVDVLVNNAGIVTMDPDPLVRLRTMLECNLVGPYAVSLAFKPLLLAQASAGAKDRRLIYVSSDLGSMGLFSDPDYKHKNLPATEYRVTKAGMNMLAAAQQNDLGKGEPAIKVFSWSPGWTVTALTGEDNIDFRRKNGANEPDFVAKACLKLVDGSMDQHAGGFIDEHLKTLPW